MPWIVLIASALLEAVWATALGMSEGLTRLVPSLVFLIATTLSTIGLWWAAKTIPMGTAYAVWTGLGAALTAGYAMIYGTEPATILRIIFLAGIVASAVGLKLVSEKPSTS